MYDIYASCYFERYICIKRAFMVYFERYILSNVRVNVLVMCTILLSLIHFPIGYTLIPINFWWGFWV